MKTKDADLEAGLPLSNSSPYDLAEYVDEERISKLFIRDRVFVVFGQLGGELVSLARTMPFA